LSVTSAKRVGNWVLLMVFVLSIVIPLFVTLQDEAATYSNKEKRLLAGLPKTPNSLSSLESYPRLFDDFFQDGFGLRGKLVSAYNSIKRSLGDSPSNRVVLGKDGWLFLNDTAGTDPVGDARNANIFSDDELKAYAGSLEKRRLWLQKRGVAYLYVIAPNKNTIYPELLPDYLSKVRDESSVDQLYEYLFSQTDVAFVDLREPLTAAKSEWPPLYFKLDTHWNSMGANVAQFEIARAIAKLLPDWLEPELVDPSEFKQDASRVGDLSAFVGARERISYRIPDEHWKACARPQHSVRKWRKREITTRCKGGKKRVLVFRDSFFTHLQPYLSGYFRKATYVWKSPTEDLLRKLLKKYRPHIVIEEHVERKLPVRSVCGECFPVRTELPVDIQ